MKKSRRLSSIFLFVAFAMVLSITVGCAKKENVQVTLQELANSFDNAQEYALQFSNAEGRSVDVAQSKLVWKGGTIVGTDHSGTVDIHEGLVFIQENKIAGGEFVIDMSTIKDADGSERLEEHLKGDDFFVVDQFPEATFQITLVRETGIKDVYNVSGDLTIKKIKKSIVFPATITRSEDGHFNVKANFRIDRTQWHVDYNSTRFFKQLGDKAIRDEIEFDLSLQTK